MIEKSKVLNLEHDGTITIAVGRSRKETNWKNRQMFWSDLAEKLSQTTRTSETLEEIGRASCRERV